MRHIARLDLSHNRFTEFPKGLFSLENLEILKLDHNKIGHIPDEIEALVKLYDLNLDYNELTELPVVLAGMLRRGTSITFAGNPVVDKYPEILYRDKDTLAPYIQSLVDGQPQYEAKILVVGEGNAGKTSIISALSGEPFIENRPTTHGIEIRALPVPHPRMSRTIQLYSWDFGGQEVYRVTHQFFFGRRVLYVLVWNIRNGQEQSEIEGWLRRIYLRVGDDAKVLLVATHAAERRPEIDFQRLQRNYPGMLVGNMIEVDSSTSLGIGSLRLALARSTAKLPHMGQVISARWANARDKIVSMASAGPQISFDEFSRVCVENGLTQDEIPVFSELLNDLGHIVYYADDEGLKDIVVLNPEWLTKAIGYILEDPAVRAAGGVVEHERLREIWSNRPNGDGYLPEYHPYFLRLMEKFDVSYRLEGEDRSLVAQLVPYERPALPWTADSALPDDLRSTTLICRLSDSAPGLIAWLTVRSHRASVNLHWRTGVFLRHPVKGYASEALLELREDHEIVVTVRAPSPDFFFSVIRDSLEEVILRRWPGVSYRMLIPCPAIVEGQGCAGAFPIEGLVRLRERDKLTHDCLVCDTEHSVQKLLTGFAAPGLPPEFEAMQERLNQVADDMNEMTDSVKSLERYAADSASSIRRVLKAISTEVTDCPRLFSIVPNELDRSFPFWKRKYILTLWCEHASAWHPVDSSYHLKEDKEWLAKIQPYIRLVTATLKIVVPIAANIAGVFIDPDKQKSAEAQLNLMEGLTKSLPDVKGGSGPEHLTADGMLTPAEGDSLRKFRFALFQVDPQRGFSGLRRVQAPSGELLWVCNQHYVEYDPGLPQIPQPRIALDANASALPYGP